MTITIKPYQKLDKEAVLELSIQAWSPVFPKMEKGVPKFVYDNFYSQGWEKRQINDLTAVLNRESVCLVSFSGGRISRMDSHSLAP
ncbi:hypothetical protein [Streptococcus sanguinis]|uniref:hypothetical protein n=1 Tax=Streptococcus sanguinis TaxID=1305 RepID=UPI001CBCB41E|nr:hypothetical protein [Streptococcus sanguinis]MCC3177715.1 gNAT family acetyltransferase [Streptococcus sanguinis]